MVLRAVVDDVDPSAYGCLDKLLSQACWPQSHSGLEVISTASDQHGSSVESCGQGTWHTDLLPTLRGVCKLIFVLG